MPVSKEEFVRAYLERIDYHGSTVPCLETLQAVQEHQYRHIPFENLEMLKPGFAANLDLEYLFDKIILHRRGGVCFEMTTLYVTLLQALGFHACRLNGSVDPGERIQTHAATLVRLPEGEFLADVSFGEFHLPVIPIAPDTPVQMDHWTYWVEILSPEKFVLRGRRGEEAEQTLYYMNRTPCEAADYREAFRWMVESRKTFFTSRLHCSFYGEHHRALLHEHVLTVETYGEGVFQCPVPVGTDATAYLRQYFNIDC